MTDHFVSGKELEPYIYALERQSQLDNALRMTVYEDNINMAKSLLDLGAQPCSSLVFGAFDSWIEVLKISDEFFELLLKHAHKNNENSYGDIQKYKHADVNKLSMMIDYKLPVKAAEHDYWSLNDIIHNAICRHLSPIKFESLLVDILKLPAISSRSSFDHRLYDHTRINKLCYRGTFSFGEEINLIDLTKEEYVGEMNPDYIDHLFGIVPEFGTNGTCDISHMWL